VVVGSRVAEETRSFKAEPEVRPPPTRRDHLAGDQCSGTIKAMKERDWDRWPAALQRGPATKAEPPSGGFSFRAALCVPLHAPDPREPAVRAEIPQTTGPSSRRRNPQNTESRSARVPRSSARSKLYDLSSDSRSSLPNAPTGTRVQDCESRVIRDSDGSEHSSCGGEAETERERERERFLPETGTARWQSALSTCHPTSLDIPFKVRVLPFAH